MLTIGTIIGFLLAIPVALLFVGIAKKPTPANTNHGHPAHPLDEEQEPERWDGQS